MNPRNYFQHATSEHAALLGGSSYPDGLYPDEAAALLNTGETSYFKAPGMRILFLLPQTKSDHYLPVKVSVDTKISPLNGRTDLAGHSGRSAITQPDR